MGEYIRTKGQLFPLKSGDAKDGLNIIEIDGQEYNFVEEKASPNSLVDFYHIKRQKDGSFKFETYHYSGVGRFTCLLEGKLK